MRKLVASCSAVLIAAAVLAACGGSSSKSNPLTSDTKKPASSSDGGGSSSDFSKLVADATKEKFKITYSSGGTEEQTYAQDGEGNSVYSTADSQYFTSATGSVSCRKDSSGKAQCTEIPGAGNAVSPFLTLANTGKTYIDALGTYGHKTTKTIADRTAQCLSFSAADLPGAAGAALGGALKGSATYCIDKETGVLLEVSGTDADGKDSTGLKVSKFGQPSDSDFTPPATATKITIPPGLSIPGS